MKSQKKKTVWLLDNLTDETIQQKLDQLSLYLGNFRRLVKISILHLSEIVDVHKSCLGPNSLRPGTQISSVMKYFFSIIELNDMHLHTSHVLKLLWQCRMENKELIIKVVDPDRPLEKDEYLLLQQKRHYTPPEISPEEKLKGIDRKKPR